MATIFYFITRDRFIAEQHMKRLNGRGDLEFAHKIFMDARGAILISTHFGWLNEYVIEVLSAEFNFMYGYHGFIVVTTDILRNPAYDHMLLMNADERMIVLTSLMARPPQIPAVTRIIDPTLRSAEQAVPK